MELVELYQGICEWWGELGEEKRDREVKGFAPNFAYNSARIEDEAVEKDTVAEVFSSESVTDYSGKLATINLVQDQLDALSRLRGDVDRERAFDESLVLEAHASLTWGTYSPTQLADGERPGTYKLGDYLVPGAPEVGAAAEDVPGLVADLCHEVNDTLPDLTRGKALTVASYFHCSFETINPFSDGNGLTGRELMNYVLLAGGHPPVIIYEGDKGAYFEALEAFNAQGDLKPFKRFLMAEAIKTWRERVKA